MTDYLKAHNNIQRMKKHMAKYLVVALCIYIGFIFIEETFFKDDSSLMLWIEAILAVGIICYLIYIIYILITGIKEMKEFNAMS